MKTRFAPSPTGYLHIGSVRTALFSWLHARHHGGQFVLRIEDTDRERSTQQSIDAILEGLRWLNIDWDEGPYFQTDRYARYAELAERLIEEGKAYRCYCTREELEAMRAEQTARGENPRYNGRCRARTEPREGVEPVIRFRTPAAGHVVIEDLVRGAVTYDNAMLDDLVIMRADGTPTFHFGVVVDDADMAITHVIRGDDHLNNTARHVHMIDALGFARPVFAHLPMILGEDGARLSKRHGAVNVLDYRDAGYLPDAILNYLVRLGWSHGDQEIFSRAEMIALFDVSNANASASRFNAEKLRWLNQQYIMATDPAALVDDFTAQLLRAGIEPAAGPAPLAVIAAYRERAETLGDLAATVGYLYRDAVELDPASARKQLRPVMIEPINTLRARLNALNKWHAADIQEALQATADAHEMKFGKLGQPVRVAVTGGSVSPPIDVTVELVGQDRTLARLDAALQFMQVRAEG
ncbi:MAG: glutamate--tRNA ligase [Gammaproteobacteria bacterium]|jgi:glutamyl-tRNA synthetase|nr:glutamate--tRNA ligase [Gammaproteobacteria bacterium]